MVKLYVPEHDIWQCQPSRGMVGRYPTPHDTDYFSSLQCTQRQYHDSVKISNLTVPRNRTRIRLVESAVIIHNGLCSVNLVCMDFIFENKTVLGSPQVFYEIILLWFVLHDTFHVGVRQRIQKLILHQIRDLYPHICFINNGLQIYRKLYVQCDSLKVIFFSINSN